MMTWQRVRKAGVVIETLIFLAGFGLLAEGFMAGSSAFKLASASEVTQGTVVGLSGSGFSLDIQFTDANSNTSVFQQYGPFFGRKMGEQVAVVYDPANSTRVSYDGFGAIWFKTFVLIFPGALLVIWGLRMRSHRSL